MKIELLSHTQNPELLIATAAKLCYSPSGIKELMEKQTPEMIENFIKRLTDLGHESPLEHASFTFAVEGVSRILEIQLVRHRLASYSIQSGRYVKREKPNFIKPERIAACEPASMVFDSIAERSIKAYNEIFLILMLHQMGVSEILIENMCYSEKADKVYEFYERSPKLYKKFEKIAIEDARYVHLQSIETKIIFTNNLRSLINFTRHRECNRAQTEIRRLSEGIIEIMDEKFPLLSKMLGAPCRFGHCPEGSMCCGHPKPSRKN